MTESEKAEQDVAAARVAERIAEWKAMEAKASYYHYASKAMEASAEVMGARIRRDNAIAAEFADKVLASALSPAPPTVSDREEGERTKHKACGDLNCETCYGNAPVMSDFSRGAQDAIDGDPRKAGESEEYYSGYDATTESIEGPVPAPEVRKEDEQDAPYCDACLTVINVDGRCDGCGRQYPARATTSDQPPPQEAPAIPEGGEAKLGPRDPFLDSILERGGTWHDGGNNPAPNWFVDIYVPAAETNLGDKAQHLEGQPSNAYIWGQWEVAYVRTKPMYLDGPLTSALRLDETPKAAADAFNFMEAQRAAEGWVPVEEFRFPLSDYDAIVETRWSDGYCEQCEFAGVTPTTAEPVWRSQRTNVGFGVIPTHHRLFAKPRDAASVESQSIAEMGETLSGLDSQGIQQDTTEQTEHDRPKLTNEEFESLEKIDGVLDAEPSPILRSEVPPAAETYLAPSGDEFATVNGQTHLIVSDEAEAQGQAETAPQAAYAPIHNEDEPVIHPDAAFWAKALPAEAEAKAEPKRINIFGIEFGGGAKKTLVGEGV